MKLFLSHNKRRTIKNKFQIWSYMYAQDICKCFSSRGKAWRICNVFWGRETEKFLQTCRSERRQNPFSWVHTGHPKRHNSPPTQKCTFGHPPIVHSFNPPPPFAAASKETFWGVVLLVDGALQKTVFGVIKGEV